MEPTNNQSNTNNQPQRPPRPPRNRALGEPPRPARGPRPQSGPKPAQPEGRGAASGNRPGDPFNTVSKSNGGRGRDRRPRMQQKPLPVANAVPVNRSIYNGLSAGAPSKPEVRLPSQQGERTANRASSEKKLRVIPLGGLGEVGKNMMAIEYGSDIIVVDMGFAFPNDSQPGIDYTIPVVEYLEKKKQNIRGIIITHGHEDHIGGIPFILPKIPAPVYGARFTLGMIEKKLVEYRLQTAPQFRVLDPDRHERVQLGAFTVELLRVTHSIPDACAVIIKSPVGTIVHSGDYRLDPNPVDGKQYDLNRLGEIAKEGVLMFMGDSTSCEVPGRTTSEVEIEPTFMDLFARSKGRVIVSAIASNIHRMQTIINAAQRSNRKVAFVGRSMLSNVELAVKLGYLKIPAGMVRKVNEIVNVPDEQFLVLCTGHQGEENSALNRMATGEHPNIKIKQGDSVILSSSIIPGNEVSVVDTVDGLLREGAKVYQQITRDLDECGRLHSGGHAQRDDIVDMLNLIKPKYYLPIHGEFHHLVRNADLAVQTGMPKSNVFVMDNGDVLELTAGSAKRAGRVPSGFVMIDGSGVGDVEGVVLRDRLSMAKEGIFVVVVTIDRKTGKLVTSPDIISRGFVYMKENEELISRARMEVRKAFERRAKAGGQVDWQKFKLDLRDDLANYLYDRTKRSPMVIPVVNEI